MAYADVVVVGSPGPLGRAFSYAVAAGLTLVRGDAVLAPFGKQMLPGIVVDVHDQPRYAGELRRLSERIGAAPLIAPERIALAAWLSERYLAPLAATLALMLPRGASAAADLLPPSEPAVPALRLALAQDEALRLLAVAPPATAGRALRSLLALLDAGRSLALVELRGSYGLTKAVETLLLESGIAEHCSLPGYVLPPTPLPGLEAHERPRLNAAQQQAIATIARTLAARLAGRDAPAGLLLHGVTGSGKTEVYLAALELARRQGRRGIVLVPEIALTAQTVARFEERFPGRVAILHGKLSPSRHRAQWFGARAGEYDVVVGARSALFAPLPDLGLIVLDEEHDPSFKQSERAPCYHARETAAELARLTGAVLLLGSATPDVASYRRAQVGGYGLLRLPERVGAGEPNGAPRTLPLPPLEVVDMARELRAGNANVLSRSLDAAIERTLAAGDQALLFLNRRGTASLLLCRDCGYAPRCQRCAVALALHLAEQRLMCHHCNAGRRIPTVCPQCGSKRFRPVGIGTQRLESLMQERFPAAHLLRWDADTATTAGRHAEFGAAVHDRRVNLIVGTQMVAKGHDFGGVTLVGVVSADLSLNLPDFRAAERTFQLLVQVAGRAGRRERPGQVVVQTYAPQHYAIAAAATHDYASFYRRELAFRQELAYPPCGELTRLVLSHPVAATAEHKAERFAAQLSAERERLGLPGPEVVGPAPCFFSKLNNRFRWQILLRGPAAHELLSAVPPPSGWGIDVDPVEVL